MKNLGHLWVHNRGVLTLQRRDDWQDVDYQHGRETSSEARKNTDLRVPNPETEGPEKNQKVQK